MMLDIPINHHLDVLYIDAIEVFIIVFYEVFFFKKKERLTLQINERVN